MAMPPANLNNPYYQEIQRWWRLFEWTYRTKWVNPKNIVPFKNYVTWLNKSS